MQIEGPIAGNEAPVGGIMPGTDGAAILKEYDYVEEEFFISGTANVYGPISFDAVPPEQQWFLIRKPLSTVRQADTPYKTRVVVTRPRDPAKFSGYVHVIPCHVLSPYGILDADLIGAGHAHVAVEVNDGARWGTEAKLSGGVAHLKRYDPTRYASLSIVGGDPDEWGIPDQVVAEAWQNMSVMVHTAEQEVLSREMFRTLAQGPDVLLQVGTGLKLGGSQSVLPGWDVRRTFTRGGSGSSLIPNSLVNDGHHNRNMLPDGRPPFDGYFIFVGLQVGTTGRPDKAVLAGFLSENEVLLKTGPNFPSYVPGLIDPPENTDDPRFRYYEMPATWHIYTAPIPGRGTIVTGLAPESRRDVGVVRAPAPREGNPNVPAATAGGAGREASNKVTSPIVAALWNDMYAWLEDGIPMPVAEPIARDPGSPDGIARDEHGNALGGLRTPWVDVPEARYKVISEPGDPDSSPMKRFSAEKMRELYGTKAEYERRVRAYNDELVAKRLLRPDQTEFMAPPPTIDF